jgi:hypothetical protein
LKDYKVVVVDNDSADKTSAIVREKFPEMSLIQQKKNYFLCKSNNDGIEFMFNKFDPEFILVLNPDTKLESDTLQNLLKTIESDKKIGAVGPKVKFFNNKDEGLINSAGIKFDGFRQAYDRGFRQKDRGQLDEQEEVQAVSGVCVLYRSKALKQVGFYWETLKMYMDELELSIRLRKKGWKIIYEPKAVIHHSYMASTSVNKKFSINKQKEWAWLMIALRHYGLRSKLAMIRKYILNMFK